MKMKSRHAASKVDVLTLALAGVLACALLPKQAFASTGCDALQGSFGPGFASAGTSSASGFKRGDIITAVTSGGAQASLQDATTSTFIYFNDPAGFTYPVPADTPDNLVIMFSGGPGGVITFSCVSAPSTGPTNSQILEQTRQTFSKVGAQASSQALGDATSGAIDDAFSGGGTTQVGPGAFRTNFAALETERNTESDKKRDPFESFNALGYAKVPYVKAPPRLFSPWHVWIDGRYTGFDDKNVAGFDGWHTNVTGGASYRFTQNFLAGVLVGYENSKYSMAVAGTPTSLKGEGVSGGGYFGWKFYDRLRLDGMLTYGRIDYGADAGPVSGAFGADRITGMAKLSGRYGFGQFYLEPSTMVTIASESQDSFTDSAAVFHDRFNFTVGRASTGGTVGIPLAWGLCVVTPTFGAFGDYRFGDETTAALSTVPTFNNGWSAHVNGGLSVAMLNGVTASASGEYGGLGQDLTYWRAKASLGVKF